MTGTILEVATAVAALVFGFLTVATIGDYPSAVIFFIRVSGVFSLIASLWALEELCRANLLSRPLSWVFRVALFSLALGYLLSVSPELRELSASRLEAIGAYLEALLGRTADTLR